MKNFIIVSSAILLIFAITSSYAATDKNYYKRDFCKFTDIDGHRYRIARITKIYDKNQCLQIAKMPSSETGCSTGCVAGNSRFKNTKETMDQRYVPLFKEKPFDRIYIHFKNSKIKLESIFIFEELPSKVPAALLERTINELKSDGAEELKVVYPEKNITE